MNDYVYSGYELEYVCTSTKWLLKNLDAKYENSDSNKAMKISAST